MSTARQPDALLSWMGSLSDPTRLRLLRLLERHELGVAELCAVLQMPQSTVSRHLKVLVDEGWIRGREPAAQAFFAGAAGEWDRLRAELYGTAFTQAALLALLPGQWTVADLGCGTGQLASLLSPWVASVIG